MPPDNPNVPAAREVLLNVRPFRHALPLSLAFVLLQVVGSGVATGAAAPGAPRVRAGVQAPAKAVADTAVRHALIIEGDDHLFMVAAPPGWVLDDTSGMGSRIRCVFYPQGQKWATAPTVMYVNPMHGFGAKERTLATLVAEDEQAFHKRAPRGKISEAATIATTGKKQARVRYFADDGGQPHEAVAYVPEKSLVMLIVLTARSPQGFQKALPAYHRLVESYAFVGTNHEFGK